MKLYGIYNDSGRVVQGLLNEDDTNAFLDKYDPDGDGFWMWADEEDPATSDASEYLNGLADAIKEMDRVYDHDSYPHLIDAS